MNALLAIFLTSLGLLAPLAAEEPKAQDKQTPDKQTVVKLPALLVGAPAPPLGIDRWVRGGPIEKLEPGRVYLVLVCGGPFPNVNEHYEPLRAIRAAHADAKLSIFLTCSWDDDSRATDLEENAQRLGTEVTFGPDFGLAWERKQSMEKSWRRAASRVLDPAMFLVDGKGRIAWMGDRDELRYLEPCLSEVLADTHDIEKAAREYKEYFPVYKRVNSLVFKAGAARLRKDTDKAIEILTEIVTIDVSRSGHRAKDVVAILRDELNQPERARTWATEMMAGAATSNAEALNGIALGLIAGTNAPDDKDRELATRAAKSAVGLSKEKNAEHLNTLALAQASNGDLAAAIATQRKAAAIDARSNEKLREYEGRLEQQEKR